ncbi:TonB-dependent receptor [Echinimonas agarilytica]|uniref:TonB-dependent receptor n=1 Tax=Echinimonas agarilytica TaxID=1215918 RepID=A0AA41W8G3_9GAMM|nr:TonB-dependent receptor [Echinimonas agarilytica]MCM2680593.1 TonB-dependent receptor [Echinimonas agarilytica]
MISKVFKRGRVACALALALGVSGAAYANETASGIRGTIVDASGQPVTDAKITIVHQPTGTVSEVVVNEQGRFNARGLRVGGPYTVSVDSDSHSDDSRENVYLNLGETLRFTSVLEQAGIETIQVKGARLAYRTAGSNSDYGLRDIEDSPTMNRDLKEIARMNPFAVLANDDAGTFTVAGLNPKTNTLLVDGIGQNDDFGLNSNGYPTQRSPISLEAIEQVALNTTPFSSRYGGFSGAQMNAVTKSGSNEVTGSVFYEFTNDSMAGDGKDPITGDKSEQEFEEKTYGGSIGFPIIKDTLFFFGAYEYFKSPRDADWGPAGTGAANEAEYISLEDANEVVRIANEVYGANAGGWGDEIEEEDEKLLIKIDWNVNDDHRAAFTYQHSESNDTRNEEGDSDELKLSSHWYDKNETLKGYSLQFFSDWTSNFSTDIRVSYKDVTSEVSPLVNSGMGHVTVYTGENDWGDPINSVVLGTDEYRHANELDNQNLELRFAGTYLLGDHEIGFGIQHNRLDTFNMFVPTSLGKWDFDSIEDFASGSASDLEYQNAYTGNPRDAAAEFTMNTTALFAEDVWAITDDLELTYGLRYERMDTSDKPTLNENFQERYGFKNNETIDGLDIWLPRIGFKYQVLDNLQVRGGAGRFSGGQPTVWLANSFSNDGITNVEALDTSAYLDNANPTEIPQGLTDSLVPGDGYVNSLDPKFDLPSDWRYNLAIDYTTDIPYLGKDWYFGTEFLYIDRENDVAWVDLAREATGTTPGGRTVYTPIDKLTGEESDRYDLMLTNAEKDGRNRAISFTMSKAWESGVRFSTSYTNTDIDEGNQGSSSQATSNYQYTAVGLDRNGTTIGPGYYEVEHRWILTLGYDTEFVSNYKSTFNVFWERRSGQPINYGLGAFRNGSLGDQPEFDDSDYYLPYIPTGADDPAVNYRGDLTYEAFMDAARAIGMGGDAGGYGGKSSGNQPWVSQLDFRFTQELPGFYGDNRFLFYFDVKNVLNLLNDDWGQVKTKRYGSDILVDYSYDQDTGEYTYSVPYGQEGLETRNWDDYNVEQSAWRLKAGIRYNF